MLQPGFSTSGTVQAVPLEPGTRISETGTESHLQRRGGRGDDVFAVTRAAADELGGLG